MEALELQPPHRQDAQVWVQLRSYSGGFCEHKPSSLMGLCSLGLERDCVHGMHPGTAQAGLNGTINALDPGWRGGLGAPTRAPSPALLQCPQGPALAAPACSSSSFPSLERHK